MRTEQRVSGKTFHEDERLLSFDAEESMVEILDDDLLGDDADEFDADEAFLAEEIRMRMDR
jgi:hypothetical protein